MTSTPDPTDLRPASGASHADEGEVVTDHYCQCVRSNHGSVVWQCMNLVYEGQVCRDCRREQCSDQVRRYAP